MLVRSCRTVSPLPVTPAQRPPSIGGLFSVALSCGSPRLAVSQHPALRSPDLPRQDANSTTRVCAWPRPPGQLNRHSNFTVQPAGTDLYRPAGQGAPTRRFSRPTASVPLVHANSRVGATPGRIASTHRPAPLAGPRLFRRGLERRALAGGRAGARLAQSGLPLNNPHPAASGDDAARQPK